MNSSFDVALIQGIEQEGIIDNYVNVATLAVLLYDIGESPPFLFYITLRTWE